jgi:hypothetical protein
MNFLTALTLVFITLKLTDYIDWNWLWVLSPTLTPIFILILLALVGLLSKIVKR